jgi:hypothetical protein
MAGMTVRVLVHSNCESFRPVEEAISIVNQLQPFFRLEARPTKWLPNDCKKKVGGRATERLVRKRYSVRPVIAVIQTPMRGGWFDNQSRDVWIVSTARWDERFAPPPLVVFLIYEFACALAVFVSDLHNEQIDAMRHKKLRGCVFDETSGKRELLLGLVAAHLCARCEGRLSEMGVSDRAIEAIFSILAFVRAFVIRRPRSTPALVFVGHGRSDDWKPLDSFLTGLGLSTEEFNSDPTAGVHTTERLSDMLNDACFALLVMTAEDVHDDGHTHARENVVHEIGLFQGKIGFRKAIIIKEKGTAEFSNIAGLTHIPYPKGRIQKAFLDIAKTLVREGVLDPGVGGRFVKGRKSARS